MWSCEDKLNRKTAHFRLPSVAQKRCMLKLPSFIRARDKRKQTKFAFFSYYRMHDLCVVFECTNGRHPENGTGSQRVPFLNDHCPACMMRRKKWIYFEKQRRVQ